MIILTDHFHTIICLHWFVERGVRSFICVRKRMEPLPEAVWNFYS